ncbi:MAG: DUF6067 family protein, partial [Candidatus Omnitrophica bacterium]|nr:DUF6067 family protein [Candidatus Omnitrophota bacterium]
MRSNSFFVFSQPLLLFFIIISGSAFPGGSAEVTSPFLRVPKVSKPPVIDGSLNFSDWSEACRFTGMVNLKGWYLGPDFDTQWYLAHDQHHLYIAALCWMPQGTSFLAQTSQNDDGMILSDDHLEIQFSFYDRDQAGSLKFYKIMVNPLGAVYDTIYNWLPGQDRADWTAGKIVSQTHLYLGKQHWVVEMAIPLKELEMDKIEGKKMLLQVVRASGTTGEMFYCGWVGAPWMNWSQFGEVYFDGPVTGFSLVHLGNISKGGIQLRAIFFGKGYSGERKVKLLIENRSREKILYSREIVKTVVSGDRVECWQTDRLPIEKEGNILAIKATQENPEGEVVLYQAEIPFVQIDKKMEETYIQPWLARHKWIQELKVNYRYAYAPSFNKIHVWVKNKVDLNLVQEKDKERAKLVAEADRLVARVLSVNGQEISRAEGKITNQEGETVIILKEPLPEGKYVLHSSLFKASELADEGKEEFVRQYFPWENDQLGKEKVVIPPYTPIQLQEKSLIVWGRKYLLGDTGLPISIQADGQEILSGEISLESKQAGVTITATAKSPIKISLEPGYKFPQGYEKYWYQATCPKVSLETTEGYGAKVKGVAQLGQLGIKVNGQMDYTGWYRVNLQIIPEEKIKVESLDLVIPFSGKEAQLMAFKNSYNINSCGRIPPGEGVIWKSTQISNVINCLNSFVPIAFVGNYSRGLRWYAEWDRGWVVEDREPLMQLERVKGKLFLRCRLVNTPAVLDRPREIEFVLQAVPMKPKPTNYRRIAWKYPEPLFAHDTSGNRYYGNALDTITLYTEEEYQALKDFYYHWPIQHGRRIGKGTLEYGMSWLEPARKGYPLVEYGSTWVHGIGCQEMPVFKGEWCLGEFDRVKHVEVTRKGTNNYGATTVFQTDDQVTEVLTAANESFIDFFIYYMTRLAEKCGINGTFYDNWTPYIRFPVRTDITGDAYRREDGRFYGRFNVFRRHEWTKRLATAFW